MISEGKPVVWLFLYIRYLKEREGIKLVNYCTGFYKCQDRKHAYVLFKIARKEILPADLFIISTWSGEGTTPYSKVHLCLQFSMAEVVFLLWVCSVLISGVRRPAHVHTLGCSQHFAFHRTESKGSHQHVPRR